MYPVLQPPISATVSRITQLCHLVHCSLTKNTHTRNSSVLVFLLLYFIMYSAVFGGWARIRITMYIVQLHLFISIVHCISIWNAFLGNYFGNICPLTHEKVIFQPPRHIVTKFSLAGSSHVEVLCYHYFVQILSCFFLLLLLLLLYMKCMIMSFSTKGEKTW